MQTQIDEHGMVHTVGDCPTLRDQFAMATLTGLLAFFRDSSFSAETVAQHAYKTADAMLEARKVMP